MQILRTYRVALVSMCMLVFGGCVLVTLGSLPPSDFPIDTAVLVPKNAGLSQISDSLERAGAIRSQFLYKAFVVLLGGRSHVGAGDYFFSKPESVLRVAYRTVNSQQDLPRIKVTVPEGLDVRDTAQILFKSMPGFDVPLFLALAKPQEGYLFPDTYFFTMDTSPREVVQKMRETFDSRIESVDSTIKSFIRDAHTSPGGSLSDIVKMASIVEKEATSTNDRRIIAGILWKRVAAGIPLQVDVAFYYLFGKSSAELTADDLKTQSPYNLYLHTGLPPAPFDDPGLDAIIDTVTPVDTTYWYYLSDKSGGMHYAATLEGHNANKAKYLR